MQKETDPISVTGYVTSLPNSTCMPTSYSLSLLKVFLWKVMRLVYTSIIMKLQVYTVHAWTSLTLLIAYSHYNAPKESSSAHSLHHVLPIWGSRYYCCTRSTHRTTPQLKVNTYGATGKEADILPPALNGRNVGIPTLECTPGSCPKLCSNGLSVPTILQTNLLDNASSPF